MANRQLQGAIFKLRDTSYLVLEDNQWDSDQLVVRSIDQARQTLTLPRLEIEQQLSGRTSTQAVAVKN